VRALLIASVAVATAGCGQQGPLVLPENARPIERLPNSAPAPEPESQDDERRDER
jgi:predicted small lipoprotein YifL